MPTLIVGHYNQQQDAESAARSLVRAGVPMREFSLFFVNPEGQHGITPIGGDEHESEGATEANSGAVRGAVAGVGAGALAGAAAIPVLGPVGPLFGAGVGAYTGSLVGALKNMDDAEKTEAETEARAGEPGPGDHPRRSGFVLAVAVATPEERSLATEILGERAEELEEAEGTVQDGNWVDFDPRQPVKTIE